MATTRSGDARVAQRTFGAAALLVVAAGQAAAGEGEAPRAIVVEAHSGVVRSVVWTPDGSQLVSSSFDGTVQLRDPRTGACGASVRFGGARPYWTSISRDGRVYATGADDGGVRIWSPGEAEGRPDRREHPSAAWAGALSPDGRRLVSGGPDGTLVFWDVPADRAVARVRHTATIGWIDGAPDGSTVAVTSMDGFLTLYDTRTGGLVRSFGNHAGGMYDVAFSHDGTLVATAGADRSAKVWRVADGVRVATLPHFGPVYAAAFSPDDGTLATGGEDCIVKLWDARTGAFKSDFTGVASAVWDLAFSPDGRRIACAGADGAVVVWEPGAEAPPPAAKLPVSVDLRPVFERWRLGVVAQRTRSTCSLHTFTRGLEFALSRREDRGVPLSDEYLNWACNQVIGNVGPAAVDRGQFFEHSWRGYLTRGICRREEMPFTERFQPGNAPSKAALDGASGLRRFAFSWRMITGQGVPDAEVVLRTKAVLAAGWPVLAGSSHSVLVVGYADDPAAPGGGRFIVADSGTGGFIDRVTPDRLHSAIAYSRVEDYGFSWILCHDPYPRVGKPDGPR